MNQALVVLLAVIWALILLPSAVRGHHRSPRSTVGGFQRAMGVLARRRSGGRDVLVLAEPERVVVGVRDRELLARRRRVFTTLVVATGVTFLLAVVGGGRWWLLWLATATALASYVVLLLRWKAQRLEAAEVVRRLPVRSASEDALARVVGGTPDVQVVTDPDEPWRAGSGVRIRRWEG